MDANWRTLNRVLKLSWIVLLLLEHVSSGEWGLKKLERTNRFGKVKISGENLHTRRYANVW